MAQGTPSAPGVLALVREDFERHDRKASMPGFRALVMYRFGAWTMGVPRGPVFLALSVVYLLLHRFVRNHHGIELHRSAVVGRRLRIAHQGGIVIHERAVIGDDCLIRQGVTIGAPNDEGVHKAPRLGDRVEVGAGAVILGAITVGDGAKIGPNAVVMSSVPPGATAFAPPARTMQIPPRRRADVGG